MSSEGYDASPNLGDVLDMMEGYAREMRLDMLGESYPREKQVRWMERR